MEFFSYLVIICFLSLVVLTLPLFLKKTKYKEKQDDLVDFIFNESSELFELLSEDLKSEDLEQFLQIFSGWMLNMIKSSTLPAEMKAISNMDTVSLLSKPILELLYNNKFGKSRLIELRNDSYSEEEQLVVAIQEMRFIYDHFVSKNLNKE